MQNSAMDYMCRCGAGLSNATPACAESWTSHHSGSAHGPIDYHGWVLQAHQRHYVTGTNVQSKQWPSIVDPETAPASEPQTSVEAKEQEQK